MLVTRMCASGSCAKGYEDDLLATCITAMPEQQQDP